jgi:type III restriction enzyme
VDLLPFQIVASTQIADRFQTYMREPLTVTRTRLVPFCQNLAAITGGGKTLILADAVEQIRSRLPIEPIVLWLSKGKVVVWQTFTNLSTGKYADLIGGFDVKPLLDCKPGDVGNATRGLLLVATVAKINQKDKEQGDRKIFSVGFDVANESLWQLLRKRRTGKGQRRPLIVVYDEGHNLSNQQTVLLMDLEPDALVAASATLRVPEALMNTMERLRTDLKWSDGDFVTSVQSSQVVESGLIKREIMLGGYVTPMEICIADLLQDFGRADQAVASIGQPFLPKAIYVSSTNAVDGVSIREDVARPFPDRRARPILIWRYLAEIGKVNPAEIAVYADLKFDKRFPPPPGFNLFSGGDGDFDRFMAGNFRHIIFNLSLQEGWDDPGCCFAYIDKDMGSPDQVTQLVGRVLRQPGAQHYASSILNTAHFYIRTDEKGVFEAILEDVRAKLTADAPDVAITVRNTSSKATRPTLPALKERSVPNVSINSAAAQKPIAAIVRKIVNFAGNSENTVGPGARMQVLQTIGSGEDAREEWVEVEHSNRVTARWVFLREIQRKHPKAAHLCDIENPKFDVLIEYHSIAADHIREQAEKVVEAYIEHSAIVQNSADHPYTVGSIPVEAAKLTRFKHALHEGYSDLNELERPFATAIDRMRKTWCRNPANGGFSIDLLDRGRTRQFKPDFLVWSEKNVFALDTKGDHLIVEDAARKLFSIEKVANGPDLVIRLVTEGEWQIRNTEFRKAPGTAGYTVWSLKQGKLHATQCRNAAEAVAVCLTL